MLRSPTALAAEHHGKGDHAKAKHSEQAHAKSQQQK